MAGSKDVDARHKAGHDGAGQRASITAPYFAWILPPIRHGRARRRSFASRRCPGHPRSLPAEAFPVIVREGGRSSNPRHLDAISKAAAYWIPAFAGMTAAWSNRKSVAHHAFTGHQRLLGRTAAALFLVLALEELDVHLGAVDANKLAAAIGQPR